MDSDSDSQFSDNGSTYYKQRNINTKMLDINERFNSLNKHDISSSKTISDCDNFKSSKGRSSGMEGRRESGMGSKSNWGTVEGSEDCNDFLQQFNQLTFDNKGIPQTYNNVKNTVKLFNNLNIIDESSFNKDSDGRYGVVSDMTHTNMEPDFNSKTKGFNPMLKEQWDKMSTRKVELYTGSDQNPQFKHKSEVGALFKPETNKVDSVTGAPVFTDFYQSRYIPSDKRQGEKPFQPVRVTPGLNLGYNQTGNTGFQDLYRALPRNIDELRPLTRPKVSFKSTTAGPAKMGEKRRVNGLQIKKTPESFYINSLDALMPTNDEFTGPAIYGTYIADQTNRSLASETTHLNPAVTEVSKSTPKYLQGENSLPFRTNYEQPGPNNIVNTTKSQNINRNFIVDPTNRINDNNYFGANGGNKQNSYLLNYDNSIPEQTLRNVSEVNNNVTGINGNYKTIPLINFKNFIPDTTKKEITEDRNVITNISNSVKSYLYNSINSIPDDTLRSIISSNIILTNVDGDRKGGYIYDKETSIPNATLRNITEDSVVLTNISNAEKSYIFNNLNGIPDPTLRNIVNTLFSQGGLNFKGSSTNNYIYNKENAIPDQTLRNIIETISNINNVTGNNKKGYLINYINSVPDTTLRNVIELNSNITNFTSSEIRGYLLNYLNSVPDTTLRNITENNSSLIGTKGNYNNNYLFNHDNAIPDQTLRSLVSNIVKIGNINGNYKSTYLINYLNSMPDTTLREMTSKNTNLIGVSGNEIKGYLINYLNSIPDVTLREITCDNVNIGNQRGETKKQYIFNFDAGIPDPTNRSQTETTKNITGIRDNEQNRSRLDYSNALLNTEKEVVAKGRAPVSVKNNVGPTQKFIQYQFCDDNSSVQRRVSSVKPIPLIKNELYPF
jgi:hypothetical protein